MKIATWNVNSVRARLPVLLKWLEAVSPDVLLLQEIKCEEKDFPKFEIEALGYHTIISGQKSYNGVALFSKVKPENIMIGLPDYDDPQARYIEADIGELRLATLYLPNGNPVGSPKYLYKLAWMERLLGRCQELLKAEKPFILGGDFNVLPEEIDVFDPKGWEKDALFLPETRQVFRRLIYLGLADVYRSIYPDSRAYSFWDYQAGSFPRNLGLRIDFFLASPEALDLVQNCWIDAEPRGWDKPSDHTPVLIELDL